MDVVLKSQPCGYMGQLYTLSSGTMTCSLVEAEKYLFNNLELAEARRSEATLVSSTGALTATRTKDASSALPCACLVSENELTPQNNTKRLELSKSRNLETLQCTLAQPGTPLIFAGQHASSIPC